MTPTLAASRASLPPEGAFAPKGGPSALKLTPTPKFIYLASQSPRRAQLLDQLGVRHELLLADDQEDAESLEAALPGESPTAYVQRVTLLKLEAAIQRRVRRKLQEAPILCADTTVAKGRTVYGKPADAADAQRMLAALSGATHRVMTAVALHTGRQRHVALSTSRVSFDVLTPARIKRYVGTTEPMGKAGAYAIQGHAAAFVSHISGSYSGIMGLPMYETAQLLRRCGFDL